MAGGQHGADAAARPAPAGPHHTSRKIAAPQRPTNIRYRMAGTSTTALPTAGMKDAAAASAPNTTGRGQADDGEADADEHALQQRRHGRAIDHGAHDRDQVVDQQVASYRCRTGISRARCRMMVRPSSSRKNSRNSVRHKLDERARDSHDKVAAQGGGRLQRGVRGLRRPVLNLCGADRQGFLHQAQQRTDHRIACQDRRPGRERTGSRP